MERTLSESKNVKQLEVTESRTDHQRAHLRRDHLVLQPPFIPTYGKNIRVNGQASKESNEDRYT